MKQHILAWKKESRRWNGGHYSLELLGSCNQGRLLDAGCGGGKYTIPLQMRGFDVVGVDVSLDALRIARERSESRKMSVPLLAANVSQLPFQDGSFDVVWCYGVLQHLLLEERELAVSEFRRILRQGGLLFLEVLGEEDMRYGGNEVESNTFSRKNGIVYHYFNKNELKELLRDFSCSIVESHRKKRFDGVYYKRHMISTVAKKE